MSVSMLIPVFVCFNRLPKKLLFDQLKGGCPPGCPMLGFNDVASRDCHMNAALLGGIRRCSEQTALARQDLSCINLAQHELESGSIITVFIRRLVTLNYEPYTFLEHGHHD